MNVEQLISKSKNYNDRVWICANSSVFGEYPKYLPKRYVKNETLNRIS